MLNKDTDSKLATLGMVTNLLLIFIVCLLAVDPETNEVARLFAFPLGFYAVGFVFIHR